MLIPTELEYSDLYACSRRVDDEKENWHFYSALHLQYAV